MAPRNPEDGPIQLVRGEAPAGLRTVHAHNLAHYLIPAATKEKVAEVYKEIKEHDKGQ